MHWTAPTACSLPVQMLKAVRQNIVVRGSGVRTRLPVNTVSRAEIMRGKSRMHTGQVDLVFLHLNLLRPHLPFRWNRGGWILR